MSSPSFDQDKELAEFFTDVEHLRNAFKDAVAAPTLAKRLFVIHGVGGVGKSSLLRMFRLYCKSVNVPVALASGDEAKSAFDILARWTADLKADGVACPLFSKMYDHYRALQAKVETEAGKIAGQAVKGAAKTVIETAASTVPGIGPLLGKLGGTSVEALADILLSRGFKRPDIDLLLDPTKKLTDDFLDDMNKAADKQRVVLMLDTFEQMTALEDWARDIAQRLPSNMLFVIAGRALPNWSRTWDSWQKNAYVEELKPMTEDVMRELIRRYYATMRGGEPDPIQVEAIIHFARGLPMVVTSAVQLWVKYGVEDFQAVKVEIVANLVDRLMEGVPSTLIPALEAAAVVRWFDQPILRAVMQQDDLREAYNELRRFPFVRVRVEGLALHDAVREIMDENLRVQDSERYRELHKRAAVYFEKRLGNAGSEETSRLEMERLYHRIHADEVTGLTLFQEMAENLTRYRLVNRLRAVVDDAYTYTLECNKSKLWRDYYNARSAELERHLEKAEAIYESILKPEPGEKLEGRLEGYTLCDLGGLLTRPSRLSGASERKKAHDVLERAQRLIARSDPKLLVVLENMQEITKIESNWPLTDKLFDDRIEICRENHHAFELIYALIARISVSERRGNWNGVREQEYEASVALEDIGAPLFLQYTLLHRSLYWMRTGRYHEAENRRRKCLEIAGQLNLAREPALSLNWLGYLQGIQDKLESAATLQECKEKLDDAQSDWVTTAFNCNKGYVNLRQGHYFDAEESLRQGLAGKQKLDPKAIPLIQIWLGELCACQGKWTEANSQYEEALWQRISDSYDLRSTALTGLICVKHAQGDYTAIPPLLAEAEQLAQQYEYNDHLASLRLTQGHIAWEGNAPTWDNGFEATLHFYQHSLIYALRYNRFLLDEVLSGRPQGSPLRPIIPHCLERGDEGRQMLIALREWWQAGLNDIGTPRPDTISPIPEGIPLLEAERVARGREPGDGSPQKSVIEQIEAALVKLGEIA